MIFPFAVHFIWIWSRFSYAPSAKASVASAALGTSRTPAAACHTARDTTECLGKHVGHLLGKWFDGMRTACHAKKMVMQDVFRIKDAIYRFCIATSILRTQDYFRTLGKSVFL